MNDQHAHAGYVGHDGYPTGGFETDPLFGALPDAGSESGIQYDATQWVTGSHETTTAAGYAGEYQSYGTGDYGSPDVMGVAGYDTTYDTTGQWDASAWNQAAPEAQSAPYEGAATTFGYDSGSGQWAAPVFESGSYDATAWNTAAPDTGFDTGAGAVLDSGSLDGVAEPLPLVPQQYAPEQEFGTPGVPDYGTREFDPALMADPGVDETAVVPAVDYESHGHDLGEITTDDGGAPDDTPAYGTITGTAPVTPRPVRRAGGGGRGRRRTPAKRSALLTVAVPSACVMGVAGIAAASVGDLGSEPKKKTDTTTLAAADTGAVEQVAANNRMDTQLAALSAEARDFGDRASRTQERIDLKARQEAERQKREAEAKRKEALRPKFALPVAQKGLSTYYGESGVNWMALHTGIDFPVDYGAEVMAATDGVVRTQYNGAYGNMVIVTAPDGTETWYCHLASAKVRSGKVKAGDVIGYAGSSGNSTGPHLHFEVRPGGGSHINPLTWLQSKGLNPL
ncbi:peptidoglycan DD-metalloendopeptidase family protein [Streptomyces sp. NPDC020875]|uniref:M23 family metallopeptidase n=1 Tax=Streptomyces sp. NPDC020875 TaxID=3154898 RepID=UPI0033D8C549